MLDLKLEGKRALVTGSSSGIGESIARLLAQAGAAVVVHGRNAERAERGADDINKQKGGKARVPPRDLAPEGGADRVATRPPQTPGGLGTLGNNPARARRR